VTEPVFSSAHELLYPEGTVLTGEVTLAKPARSLHRNGQLRFLFERVEPSAGDPVPLLASLQTVHASDDDRLAIDDEGGARATNSKTRFIAPTLAIRSAPIWISTSGSTPMGMAMSFTQAAREP
jgi:hypothetical protein